MLSTSVDSITSLSIVPSCVEPVNILYSAKNVNNVYLERLPKDMVPPTEWREMERKSEGQSLQFVVFEKPVYHYHEVESTAIAIFSP